MTTKVGSITSKGRTGAKFVEAYLSSGERVELSHAMWDRVCTAYRPGQWLVFVERRGRLFRFVHWVGTPEEAEDARAQGILEPQEVPFALILTVNTEPELLRAVAVDAARAHAEGFPIANKSRAWRLLEEIPREQGDLDAMVVFGGLPFDPAQSLLMPYDPPRPEALYSLLGIYQLTYFQSFYRRLNARLEESGMDQEAFDKAVALGRQQAMSVRADKRGDLLAEMGSTDAEDLKDMGFMRGVWIGTYQTLRALESEPSQDSPP